MMKFTRDQTAISDTGKSAWQEAARRTSEPVHPWEFLLAALVSLNLCFLPWAFGGVDLWSQIVSAGLALATLAVALVPRQFTEMEGRRAGLRKNAWRRLASFPVFWAGLVLFGYVAVQVLNPAFEYHLAGSDWWLTRLEHVRWLPAGMSVPFAEANPWHTLLVWFSPWATVCAIWVGIAHRKAVLGILTALEVNAFAFAAFGLLQRASGTAAIYGTRLAPSPDFFAALIYKNHAAAFFGLLTCVALALVVRAIWQDQRRPERAGPAILHVFFALTLMLAVGLTFSLSGIAFLLVLVVLVLPVTAWRFARTFPAGRGMAPALIATSALLILVAGFGVAVGSTGFRERVRARLATEGEQLVRPRWLAGQRGWAMFTDRWILGWGAGCFRYGFTKYQHNEPELTRIGAGKFRWEHVHDDWLELLIELGVIGMLPIAAMVAYWVRQIGRLRLWRSPAILPLLAGLGLLAVYALADFPFQNPAVLTTACALFPLTIRWSEAEDRNRPG